MEYRCYHSGDVGRWPNLRNLGWLSLFFWAISINQGFCATEEKVQVILQGLQDKLLLSNVLAHLSLEQQKSHPRLSASRIQLLHKQATAEIQEALQPFGYYRVKVTPQLRSPLANQTVWQATYRIELGPPITLGQVEVQLQGDGWEDKEFQKLLSQLPIKVGEVLKHPLYEKAKSLLTELAEERGYFEAQWVTAQVLIDEVAYLANIVLIFDTKRRYRFGEVVFHQETFEESLLRRFLTFQPGDFYTSQQLLEFQQALTDSDYFDRVEVALEDLEELPPLTSDLRVPVRVALTPRERSQYSAGIGYGTDTGVRGSIGFERRYVNRWGHRFSATAELSEIRQSVVASYLLPTGHSSDNSYMVSSGYKDETTEVSSGQLFKIGVSKNHARPILGHRLNEVIGLEYRDERYQVGSDAGHSKLLMPSVSWSYLQANDRIYTKRGFKAQLEIRGALDKIGSNTSFLQSRLNGTLIYQLHETGRLIARGDAGYSFVSLLSGDFHDLPPSIRFFAGGDRSVRGYDYQSLGPKNAEGQVIGGKNLLVGSLEYEHQVLEKWSVAAFYDVGNAFNDVTDPLKQGTGVGIRWHSPVGLIRVDVATALSEGGHPLRLHITVGPDL